MLMPLLKPSATSASILRLPTQLLFSLCLAYGADTALDRYVKAPDSTYKWNAAGTTSASGVSVSLIEMTSQTWRSAKEVDKPEWKHFIQIYKPAKVKSNIALLWIDGGNNRGGKPNPSPLMTTIANDAGVIVAELRQIPSEPLTFAGETKPRNEDGIIAYSWDKYLQGGDDNWPLRLPMTKAAVPTGARTPARSGTTPPNAKLKAETTAASRGRARSSGSKPNSSRA